MKIVRIAFGLVLAGLLLAGVPARAQTEGALAGFDGVASASGVHAFYIPEGLLPIASPVDLGSPDALATITSGPSTFARASVADPGDLLANPDALLTLASPDYPSGSIPPYPFRISAASGVGEPSAESNPAPGLRARVSARPDGSLAEAFAPSLDAPAIVSVGTTAARSVTSTDDTSVTVNARTQVNNVNILGMLVIDSIVTDVTAASTGGKPTLTGGTKVTGATLMGEPVEIDSEGVRGGSDAANALLEAAGVRVTVAGPVSQAGETAGQLASAGLLIDMALSTANFQALDDLLGQLPPLEPIVPGAPSPEDLIVAARANHLVAVHVAGAAVNLTATALPPEVELPPLDTSGVPIGGTPVSDLPTDVALPPIAGAPTAAPAGGGQAGPTAIAPRLTGDAPGVAFGAGIAGLVIAVLLTQLFIGDAVARAATTILGAGPADSCTYEER